MHFHWLCAGCCWAAATHCLEVYWLHLRLVVCLLLQRVVAIRYFGESRPVFQEAAIRYLVASFPQFQEAAIRYLVASFPHFREAAIRYLVVCRCKMRSSVFRRQLKHARPDLSALLPQR